MAPSAGSVDIAGPGQMGQTGHDGVWAWAGRGLVIRTAPRSGGHTLRYAHTLSASRCADLTRHHPLSSCTVEYHYVLTFSEEKVSNLKSGDWYGMSWNNR